MREKSQIEDMRAAVRGDLERARARREADPWRAPETERTPEPEPDQPEPEAEVVPEPEPVEEPEPEAWAEEPVEEPAAPSEPQAPLPATEPAAQRRGFFARLFGRG